MPPGTNSVPPTVPGPKPTLLTPDAAGKLVTDIETVKSSITGLTGHAVNIRLLLNAAQDIAKNIAANIPRSNP